MRRRETQDRRSRVIGLGTTGRLDGYPLRRVDGRAAPEPSCRGFRSWCPRHAWGSVRPPCTNSNRIGTRDAVEVWPRPLNVLAKDKTTGTGFPNPRPKTSLSLALRSGGASLFLAVVTSTVLPAAPSASCTSDRGWRASCLG